MPNVAALILAAGESSRFGQPKPLLRFRGESLIRRTVEAAIAAKCMPIVAVTGSSAEEIEKELRGTNAVAVENREWKQGIGSSIRAGMRHLAAKENVDAVLLLVCDQPFVDATVVSNLVKLFEKTGKPIVASSYANTFGVPAVFGRAYFSQLSALDGDTGAKSIIFNNRTDVASFSFPEGKIDIDTMEDLANLRSN